MEFIDLISRINNLINHDEVSAYFKAIRQDPLIWEGFQQLSADESVLGRLTDQKTRLNPGTLAIISIDPEFDFSHLTSAPYSRELLEKIMFTYETYLQANEPVNSFETASLLAAALIEKHKVTKRWKNIIVEIISRMRINSSEKLEQCWRTVFAIVVNLTDAKDELLFDLLDIQEAEIGLGVFLHSVMCLPMDEENLLELLKRNLVNQNGKIQSLALKRLQGVTSKGFIKNLAVLMLKKYQNLDLHSEESRIYWDNPESSLKFALQCQAAADIAEVAGEKQLALDLTNKSLEIISAIASIGKIKKSALLSESSDNDLNESGIQFSDLELNQQDIIDELIFTDSNIESEIHQESTNFPVKVLKQSRKMARAGNPELADAELMRVLKEMSDDEIEALLVKGPRFSHAWDPVDVLNTLVDAKAFNEALRLADILLKQNPTSLPVNMAAANASEGLGDFAGAEPHWELLKVMDPDSIEVKRKLVHAYRKTGKTNKAFENINDLVSSQDEVPAMDLVTTAEIALELGKLEESEAALINVFETEPENPIALTLAGLVQNQKGEFDLALDFLQKATEISGDDPRAWMTISEIQSRKGTLEDALDSLREGLAANPGNRDLKVEYAIRLMENESVSEAYPLLRELSETGIDLKVDTLLIDAMKQLGIKDLDSTLEGILERHQNDTNLSAEFGQNLVWGGKREKGLNILQKVKSQVSLKPDWATAYVEALLGSDYSVSISRQKLAPRDSKETFSLIDTVLKDQPTNTQARLLKGELLLKSEQFNKAFNIFSELLDQNENGNNHPVERINAGLAQSAAGLGRFEIALAAMQEAVNLQPEWVGLKQLLAEIQQLSGNVNDAAKQAQNTLELAPESTENVVWFANFMRTLGKKQDAEKAMSAAIEKYPKNLSLHLLWAEQKMVDSDAIKLEKVLVTAKGLIQNTDTPKDLMNAAVLYEKNKDHETALVCLSKAVGLGDLDATLNSAGAFRTHGDFKQSLDLLESITTNQAFISLLRAEVEYTQGNIEEAYRLISPEAVEIPQFEYDPVFLPESWIELFQSSSPEKSLRLTFDLKSGRHDGMMTLAREWVLSEPNNIEARIYAIEASLACGSYEDYIRFLGVNPGFDLNLFTTQFQFLKIENEVDRGDLDAATRLTEELIDIDANSIQTSIIKMRALLSAGDMAEADAQFADCLKGCSIDKNLAFINTLGLKRNLIKAAVHLNRWLEANELSKITCEETNANEELDLLALQSFVGGIEFHNSARGLGIVAHENLKLYNFENLKVEMDRLSTSLSGKKANEVKRLILHGNLAIEPTQENIRALAQVSPRPEDAAAMMAGLRILGQNGTAIQVARKFIDHPRVMNELALCLEDKDILKAIEILRKSVETYPDQVLAYTLLSRLLEKNNQLEAAAEAIEKAIGLWTDEPEWHVKAAELWTALGSTNKPLEHLKYAEELSPDQTEIQFKLGKAYISSREPGYAIKHLEVVVTAEPNRAEIWEEMSEAYILAGDLDLALISSEKASIVDPFAVKPHLQAGKVYWSKGEIEKAIDQVKLAISLKQDDADSYVFLARLFKEQGDKLKSLEALEKSSHCPSVSVQTMIDHAQLLQEINGAAAARDLVESFSKKFPENPELLKLLAEAEVECGNLKQADVTARRVLEMQPDQPSIHRFLGRIQEKSGNLDQAAHYFSQAIARNPGDTEGYLSLSKAFSKQREFDKAMEVLEEGMHRTPDDVRLYLACAVLLKESKDYRGAEQMLRKASVIDPRNINVHRQLGAVLALNLVHQSQEVSSHL